MTTIGVLGAAATTLQNLALAWLIGLVLLRAWLPEHRASQSGLFERRLLRPALLASLLLAVVQLVLLWLEAAVMGDVALAEAGPAVFDVLSGTHYGVVWKIGLALSVILVVLFWLPRTARIERGHAFVATIIVAAFAYSRSLISHAADRGDLTWAVGLDWMHLLLIGAWVGEVLVATVLVLPRSLKAQGGRPSASSFALALSRSATVVLIGVLLTGTLKAWLSVGTPLNLLGNSYGEVLIVKLIFVVLAIFLGGYNRFIVLPTMGQNGIAPSPDAQIDGQRRFLLVLRIETIVLICATGAAAVLSASVPPMSSH